MAHTTLVIGAPCSGKTTWVEQQAQPGDLIIDYDKIAQALGSPHSHDHPRSLHPYVLAAIDTVLERTQRDTSDIRIWHIKCQPRAADEQRANQIVTLRATRAGCHQRATNAGRPDRWHQLIDDWFNRNPDT